MARKCKITITPGMANRFSASANRVKMRCDQCSLGIPVYKGRYPRKCPSCGGALYNVEESSQGEYYTALTELFLSQEYAICEAHDGSAKAVFRDILRQSAMPFLMTLRESREYKLLYEALFSLLKPAFRNPSRSTLALMEESYTVSSPLNKHRQTNSGE